MLSVIETNPEVMGGAPVFMGTRVPVQNLFDYIEGDEPLDEFLDDFPSVARSQVMQLLEEIKAQVINPPKAV